VAGPPEFVKIADLFHRRIRKRPPVLVGRVGHFRLVVIDRHQPCSGPAATLFLRYDTPAPQDFSDSWIPAPPVQACPAKPMALEDVRTWVDAIVKEAGKQVG
jgi:hypothetical protein